MKTFYAKNRAEWRAWLEKHGTSESEIWLVYYKKSSGKPRVEYEEAVQEALCFGWIDGMEKGLDEQRFMQRFTPRKPKSKWSDSNIARMKKLIESGQMTPAGLAVFTGHEARRVEPKPTELPPQLQKEFRGAKEAWNNFQNFPPGYRRMTIGWVASAKKEETQHKRLQQLIETSARNEKIKFI
ncbi:MAG TPA: YdeI/OmpD-associated family protein [Terriglobales bacterium]|nr:YdeI/OmpD-associated family protein [Terriglobales bacterium]